MSFTNKGRVLLYRFYILSISFIVIVIVLYLINLLYQKTEFNKNKCSSNLVENLLNKNITLGLEKNHKSLKSPIGHSYAIQFT